MGLAAAMASAAVLASAARPETAPRSRPLASGWASRCRSHLKLRAPASVVGRRPPAALPVCPQAQQQPLPALASVEMLLPALVSAEMPRSAARWALPTALL